MTALALEINDAGILAVGERPGSPSPAPSPGYALVDGEAVLLGLAAAEQARLKPRMVHDRFWAELSTAPIPGAGARGLSHADLAYAHLDGIWNEVREGVDEVVLTVSGAHTEEQLGLVLGIARACDIPVTGMVDAATAAAVENATGRRLVHVDLDLHRSTVTELTAGREVVRRAVHVSEHTGLATLRSAWVKRIAEVFVNRTRFDPLHGAESEQVLYTSLSELLEGLCRQEQTTFEMEAGGRGHAVDLLRRDLVGAVESDYGGIVEQVRRVKRAGEDAAVLISHRVASLPGLADRLGEIGGVDMIALAPSAAASGALRSLDAIRTTGPALPFVTRLPLLDAGEPPLPAERARPAAGPAVAAGPAPTHVLHVHTAYRITETPLVLGVSVEGEVRGLNLTGRTAGISRSHCRIYLDGGRVVVEDHSTYGSFVNGQRIDGAVGVAAGDRLRLGSPGIELVLIRVEGEDGTPAP